MDSPPVVQKASDWMPSAVERHAKALRKRGGDYLQRMTPRVETAENNPMYGTPEWENGTYLDITWDTVQNELMSFMTMATLAMLFMAANISSVDHEELKTVPSEHGSAARYLDYDPWMNHNADIFIIVSWVGIVFCAFGWVVGMLIYIKYLAARVRYAPQPAAQHFLEQYAKEIHLMYYALLLSVMCSGISIYFLTMYKMPTTHASGGRCRELWGKTTDSEKTRCFRESHMFVFYTGIWMWLPVTIFGMYWIHKEHAQFNQKMDETVFAKKRDVLEGAH